MTALHERLRAMDDFQIVRFYNHFSAELFDGLQVSLDEIKAGVPEDVRRLPGFSDVEGLPPDQAETPLPPEGAESIPIEV